jgi:hypothetical protein
MWHLWQLVIHARFVRTSKYTIRLTTSLLYLNYLPASSVHSSSLLTEKRVQNSEDSLPIMKPFTVHAYCSVLSLRAKKIKLSIFFWAYERHRFLKKNGDVAILKTYFGGKWSRDRYFCLWKSLSYNRILIAIYYKYIIYTLYYKYL